MNERCRLPGRLAPNVRARVAIWAALCLAPAWVYAQQPGAAQPVTSVIQAWLAYPGIDRAEWPYSYLRLTGTQKRQQAKRQELFDEFDRLTWRLESSGRQQLLQVVGRWHARLEQQQVYREPGDWSPAWLMAHPHRSPPLARVAAIGTCSPPDWVEVWDGTGIQRVAWQGGMRLSDLSRDEGPLQLRGVDQVALVTPEGSVRHYGQAPYNYSDVELTPGTRIVAALPLGGEAFAWIRDAIANLLAHSPSADGCREMKLLQRTPQDG